jgi:hypothetical protein
MSENKRLLGNVAIFALGNEFNDVDSLLSAKDQRGVRMVLDVDSGKVAIGDARVHYELFQYCPFPGFFNGIPSDWIASWFKSSSKTLVGDKYHIKAMQKANMVPQWSVHASKALTPQQYGLTKPLSSLLQSGIVDQSWRCDFNGVPFGTTLGQILGGSAGGMSNQEMEKQASAQQKGQEWRDGFPARQFMYQKMKQPNSTWSLPREGRIFESFSHWLERAKHVRKNASGS